MTGLSTQLSEVNARGEETLKLDAAAQHHQLNQRQIEALVYLSLHKTLSIQDFEQLCPSVTRRTLQRDLRALREKGLINEIGSAPTDPGQRYAINDIEL